MLINTPISLGELVDKISILMIKKKNISDSVKLQHVDKELEFLQKTLKKYISEDDISYGNEALITGEKTDKVRSEHTYKNVLSVERIPLPENRWGFLPLSIELFLTSFIQIL